MRRLRAIRFLTCLAALLAMALLFQAAGPLPDAKSLKQSPVLNPYFYQLKLNGQTSYILGTFHLGFRLNQFPKEVSGALRSAMIFVGEDVEGDAHRPHLSKVAKFENSFFNSATRKAFQQRGIDLKKFSNQDEMLKLCLQYTFWEAAPEWSRLDRELEKTARSFNKEIVALDSSEDVTRALEQASERCEPNRLVQQISPWLAKRQFARNYQNYLAGDEARTIPKGDVDEMLLISQRNHNWLPKILKAHKKGSTFIAVGALHLGGERGLLNLLRQSGFTVERLTPSALGNSLSLQGVVGPRVFGVAAF